MTLYYRYDNKSPASPSLASAYGPTGKASVVYSVCLLAITLILSANKSAQRTLTNETKHMLPAALKDDNADSNPPFVSDTTSSVAPQSVEPFHLQPFSSPPPSRSIESTETVSAPNSTCTPNDNIASATHKPVELYHLQPSPTSSHFAGPLLQKPVYRFQHHSHFAGPPLQMSVYLFQHHSCTS
ncbi:uncharacterized protein BJ212DRAFT_1484900 [Suillus subaureus]|uniref:Uncharacterized protein n=1 Tax=Suillus subaureus TaxID=48587 RepID=A0A9P7J8F4_9AGAM|nr:uncharacterized protein BJ212DRAFT_1484900 [Suillus subaureus]KAG1808646.1 hypothetical protein BJ212DRAFT_1484900 [Suillus subaureus]